MSQTLEHIREELRTLPPSERFLLWRDLGREFGPEIEEGGTEDSVEAEWDAVVAERVREVEDGSVELIPAEEVVRQIRQTLEDRRSQASAST